MKQKIKVTSIRLEEELIKELKSAAERLGWSGYQEMARHMLKRIIQFDMIMTKDSFPTTEPVKLDDRLLADLQASAAKNGWLDIQEMLEYSIEDNVLMQKDIAYKLKKAAVENGWSDIQEMLKYSFEDNVLMQKDMTNKLKKVAVENGWDSSSEMVNDILSTALDEELKEAI